MLPFVGTEGDASQLERPLWSDVLDQLTWTWQAEG